jgi:hypothetical protein
VKTDPVARLLAVIERAPNYCSIPDAARLLRQPCQRLHDIARKAEPPG